MIQLNRIPFPEVAGWCRVRSRFRFGSVDRRFSPQHSGPFNPLAVHTRGLLRGLPSRRVKTLPFSRFHGYRYSSLWAAFSY